MRRHFLCVLRLCLHPIIACRYELFSSKQKYVSSRDTIRLPWVRVMGVILPDEVMAAPVVMMFIAANVAIMFKQIIWKVDKISEERLLGIVWHACFLSYSIVGSYHQPAYHHEISRLRLHICFHGCDLRCKGVSDSLFATTLYKEIIERVCSLH